MKSKIYLRVAKSEGRKGFKVAASTEPNNAPITSQDYRGHTFYPTVAFAVEFNIPDELFDQASKVVAEINIALKQAKIAGEIVVPEGVSIKQARGSKN